MEPMKNHYLDIPEERKLRIFREEDERFYSFWEKMLDDKQSFYQQPLKRMSSDAWHSLHSFFTASKYGQHQASPAYIKRITCTCWPIIQTKLLSSLLGTDTFRK